MGPGHRKKNEKARDFKGTIKNLIIYCKPFLLQISIIVLFSALSSILSIIGPDQLKNLTNIITAGLMTGIDMKGIEHIASILIVLYLASFTFNVLQAQIMAVVVNKFGKTMRKDIAKKINKLPLKYFDGTTVGDILSRVTNDVDTIQQSMHENIDTLVSALTMFLGSIIMMFVTDWILALVAIVSSIFGFALMVIILARSQKYFIKIQETLGLINGHIEEVFTGHNIVKAYNAEEEVTREFDNLNNNFFNYARKGLFYSGLMQPIMNFIGNFGYVAVCIVGAVLAVNGTISFGVIVAFMIYIRLFTQPLSQFATCFTGMQSMAAAAERVFEFLGEEELEKESPTVSSFDKNSVKGDIEFKNVKFGYNSDRLIIKDFSANIKAGQKIAIVGPTGAGKTTIVNLLMKFYEINEGDILIDGVSIRNITREDVHDLFTMVLQDTWLFEGTIKDNLRYNQSHIKNEDIVEACKAVGMDHFIRTLPDDYDTILGDTDSLSAGEKQLLTIARAMLNKTPFLILDEATSSVDTRTEESVQRAMDRLSRGRTSFIIAHRLSTIRNADLILVMRDGNIIEQGNHEELLANGGFYAELYNSQFVKD